MVSKRKSQFNPVGWLSLLVLVWFTCPTLGHVHLNSKYQLGWEISLEEEKVTFEVIVQNLGWVGLGLSYSGKMTDSDIVLVGVDPDQGPYIHDYHGIGNEMPVLDKNQDYTLLKAWENSTHTYAKFSRKLDTCDDQDIPITNDTVRIIWALGKTDEFHYHGPEHRGIKSLNLLDGMQLEPDVTEFQSWSIISNITMPSTPTTYWCTFHKAPRLTLKHHVVGFGPYIRGEDAELYTHHIDIYRCVPPEGSTSDQFFDRVDVKGAGSKGYDCYHTPNFKERDNCEIFEFAWTIGGGKNMYPRNVGVPFGIRQDEYYMMEIHYNNPQEMVGKTFETGIELYYTDNLRPIDAGFLLVGQKVIYTHMIPPNSENFVTPGHCPGECTSHMSQNVNMFGALVHAHLDGKKMKVRHFRDGDELPWIVSDDHFDFNYQQFRNFKNELELRPGDHLTIECTYDNRGKLGRSTIGGRSTQEEMCMTFILYYPAIPELNQCGSFLSEKDMLNYIGIENITKAQGQIDPTVNLPTHLKNRSFTSVVESIDWGSEGKLAEYQKMMLEGDHDIYCFPKFGWDPKFRTSYPKISSIYKLPNNSCNIFIRYLNTMVIVILFLSLLTIITIITIYNKRSNNQRSRDQSQSQFLKYTPVEVSVE